MVKLYPCGCSATGDDGLPDYCPEHDVPGPVQRVKTELVNATTSSTKRFVHGDWPDMTYAQGTIPGKVEELKDANAALIVALLSAYQEHLQDRHRRTATGEDCMCPQWVDRRALLRVPCRCSAFAEARPGNAPHDPNCPHWYGGPCAYR